MGFCPIELPSLDLAITYSEYHSTCSSPLPVSYNLLSRPRLLIRFRLLFGVEYLVDGADSFPFYHTRRYIMTGCSMAVSVVS